MGLSDKPLLRYSTTEMAKDVLEIIDHLGWDAERELHVAGVSMGGMIAQELVYLHQINPAIISNKLLGSHDS
jgi:pimeloyl-ACP methyl ester carboxylesterase